MGSDRARSRISVDLVGALAGDRELSAAEQKRVRLEQGQRGPAFASDVLFALCHQVIAPERAETLWKEVVQHKLDLSRTLGRNVGIAVAAMDYLSNITHLIAQPTLIAESTVSRIASLAIRDGLTGLYSHSTFYDLLEREVASHRRLGSSLGLILLDIDDFKVLNDRYGHLEGDRTLIALADAMRHVVRQSDILCRVGGDEFAVLIPLTDGLPQAVEVGERLRARLTGVHHRGRAVTISVGVAVWADARTPAHVLVDRADRALYAAKAGGKDQIVTAPLAPEAEIP